MAGSSRDSVSGWIISLKMNQWTRHCEYLIHSVLSRFQRMMNYKIIMAGRRTKQKQKQKQKQREREREREKERRTGCVEKSNYFRRDTRKWFPTSSCLFGSVVYEKQKSLSGVAFETMAHYTARLCVVSALNNSTPLTRGKRRTPPPPP